MNTETRGTLSRRGNISQITNAFVEEVNAFSNTSTGYIIVSYAASPGQQSDNIQMLRLNINRNTVILDSSGQVISLSEIRPQTWCSRSKFLSKLLKTFDKTFREIFPVFISTKRREKPSAFFDNNFVNNAYFSEAASSSSSHLASSSSKAPISSRMTCLCLWSS